MEKALKLYQYVDGINDIPFPSGLSERLTWDDEGTALWNDGSTIVYMDKETVGHDQIEIFDFTAEYKRMGAAPSISCTIKYPVCLDDKWTDNVYAFFNGERFFLKQTPTSSYSNDDARYIHEADFVSERIVLEYVYFYDVVADDVENDKPVSNSSNVTFFGDIHEFVKRLKYSLSYTRVGYDVIVDDGVVSEDKMLSFENQVISDVLQEIYKTYDLPYYFVGKTIHIGYTSNVITRPFRQGIDDALLSVKKENANFQLVNRITGTGSADNIPYFYPNDTEEGNIAVIEKNNTGLWTVDDIKITNAPLFAKKISLTDKVVYRIGKTSIKYGSIVINGTPSDFSQNIHIRMDDTKPISVYFTFDVAIDTRGALFIDFSFINKANVHHETSSGTALEQAYSINEFLNSATLLTSNGTSSVHIAYLDYIGNNTFTIKNLDTQLLTGDTVTVSLSYNITYKGTQLYQIKDFFYSVVPTNAFDIVNYSGLVTPTSLKEIGINITESTIVNKMKDGDSFGRTRIDYIIPQETLMPPIYRESLGAERFYNAVNETYINPETGNTYIFKNEYSDAKRKEYIIEFEDIKPSIKGMTNSEGQPMDKFLDFAYDANDNDNTDDNGNYLHSYFYAKLPKLDFNLFDQAIDEEEMTFSFTGGSCGGCEFRVMVDETTKENRVQVDEAGNLLYDETGKVKTGVPQERQNDTTNNEVWVMLEKDTSSFPDIMPNATHNYRPSTSDTTFVILHILLPKSYILAAEKRLLEAIIQYMYENNEEKFTFSINFSRIFLAENQSLLGGDSAENWGRLDENARLQVIYNGNTYDLYVSSFTYRMESGGVLPEISVELSGELTVNESQLQREISEAKTDITESLVFPDVLLSGLKYFLRKDVDDVAKGKITLEKGAQFGKSYADGLTGFGGKIDEYGNATLESLVLRRFLEVPELRYNRNEVETGISWQAPGGGIIESVEILSATTGIVKLHLETGEAGAVASDDLCMGIYHDNVFLGNNATQDVDDGIGNFMFKGFYTTYFRIDSVSSDSSSFVYVLRPAKTAINTGEEGDTDTPSWYTALHPQAGMHFVCYGNTNDKSRQTSVYRTRTYTRYLKGVNTWTFSEANIAMQLGDLSGLNLGSGYPDMKGYSAFLGNVYMTGTIQQIENWPLRMEIDTQGQTYIAQGESLSVTTYVYKGFTDKTAEVTSWSVVRESDGTAEISDEAWNIAHKDFKGTIELTVDDLSMNVGTMFTFTAKIESLSSDTEITTASITI